MPSTNLWERDAVRVGLSKGLLEQYRSGQPLPDLRVGEKDLAVAAAGLGIVRQARRYQALADLFLVGFYFYGGRTRRTHGKTRVLTLVRVGWGLLWGALPVWLIFFMLMLSWLCLLVAATAAVAVTTLDAAVFAAAVAAGVDAAAAVVNRIAVGVLLLFGCV